MNHSKRIFSMQALCAVLLTACGPAEEFVEAVENSPTLEGWHSKMVNISLD